MLLWFQLEELLFETVESYFFGNFLELQSVPKFLPQNWVFIIFLRFRCCQHLPSPVLESILAHVIEVVQFLN